MRTFQETPTFHRLSMDQREAVCAGGFTVIRAVAGSGKTTSLVARVIRHLTATPDRTNRLESVAVITFTTKAAGEVTARVMAEISRLVDSAPDPTEREFWLAHLRDVPGAPIGTIDAVGQAFLRRLAVAGCAGIDPDFGIATPEAAAGMAARALSRLRPVGHNPSGWGQPWDFLLRHHPWRDLESVALWLASTGGDGQEAGRSMRALIDCAERDPGEFLRFQSQFRWFGRPEAKALVDGLAGELESIVAEGDEDNRAFAGMTGEIRALLAKPCGWLTTLTGLFSILLTGAGKPKSPRAFKDEGGEHRFPRLLELQQQVASLRKTFPIEAGDPTAGLAAGLNGKGEGGQWWPAWAGFLEQFQVAFDDECRMANRYPFSTLARHLSRSLLKAGTGVAGLPLHLVLVDEFQDNTRLQWEVCCRLAGRDPHGNPGDWDNLVVVGDPQQAIYSFRGSDPTLIQSVIGKDPSRMRTIRHNHRSLAATLRGINPASQVAATAVGEAHVELETEGDRGRDTALAGTFLMLPPEPPVERADQETGDSETELANDQSVGGPGDGDADEAGDPGSIGLLAGELVKLNALGCPWGDMLVLAHSLTPFISDLRAGLGNAGVPFREMAQEDLWRTREARDIACLVECLADPEDGMALLATLRGPVGRLSLEELLVISQATGDPGPSNWGSLVRGLAKFAGNQPGGYPPAPLGAEAARTWLAIEPARQERILWLARCLGRRGTWRSCTDRMPHAGLVNRILDESGAIPAMLADPGGDGAPVELRGDRLDAILAAIAEIGDASGLPMRALAKALRDLVDGASRDQVAPDLAPGEQFVRLMTIHGAKGLDARVVAVLCPASKGPTKTETFGPRGGKTPSPRVLLGSRHAIPQPDEGALSPIWAKVEGMPLIPLPEGIETTGPSLQILATKAELDLQLREKARLFHVATTRAKDRVYLVAGSRSAMDPCEIRAWFHHWCATAGWTEPPPLADAVAMNNKAPEPWVVPDIPVAPVISSPTIPATLLVGLLDGLRNKDRQSLRAVISLRHGLREHLPKVGTIEDQGDGPDLGPVVGSLVHRCLELGDSFDPSRGEHQASLESQARSILLNGKATLNGMGGLGALAGAATRVAIRIVEGVTSHQGERLARILAKPAVVEVPFQIRIGTWTITGRIDRLLEGGDIVDWKTDSGPPAELATKYRDQMALYALAIMCQRGEGFPPLGIQAHLVHTGTGAVVPVHFGREELEAFARELEILLGPHG